jgi:hypothetical protein
MSPLSLLETDVVDDVIHRMFIHTSSSHSPILPACDQQISVTCFWQNDRRVASAIGLHIVLLFCI